MLVPQNLLSYTSACFCFLHVFCLHKINIYEEYPANLIRMFWATNDPRSSRGDREEPQWAHTAIWHGQDLGHTHMEPKLLPIDYRMMSLLSLAQKLPQMVNDLIATTRRALAGIQILSNKSFCQWTLTQFSIFHVAPITRATFGHGTLKDRTVFS